MKEGKAVIFSAPSGSGKTTLVNLLIRTFSNLGFSISATTRKPRNNEVDKEDYYFLTPEQFRQNIEDDAFVEWEEVYTDCYYGTLKSEMDRLWKAGKHVIFDVDVKGGLSLKEYFGDRAFAIFVRVPSIEELEKRLRSRKSDDEDSIQRRLAKARYEVSFSDKFDAVLINKNLDETVKVATQLVDQFLNE